MKDKLNFYFLHNRKDQEIPSIRERLKLILELLFYTIIIYLIFISELFDLFDLFEIFLY
jgi:hypothetical protein